MREHDQKVRRYITGQERQKGQKIQLFVKDSLCNACIVLKIFFSKVFLCVHQ